jgi:hypothetical protein
MPESGIEKSIRWLSGTAVTLRLALSASSSICLSPSHSRFAATSGVSPVAANPSGTAMGSIST